MKSLTDYLVKKSSVINILKPFFFLYNLFGVCDFKVNSKDFKISALGVVALIVNIIIGVFTTPFDTTVGINSNGPDTILVIGITVIKNVGLICSALIIILNFGRRNYLKKLLRAFIKFDILANTIFPPKHEKCFLIMIIFWIFKNSSFLMISSGLIKSLSVFCMNFYITTIIYMGYEMCMMMLLLVAHRIRSIKGSLIQIQTSADNRRENNQEKLKIILILLNQISDILDITSKYFGMQLMIFFVGSTFLGMFTIFTGLEILFHSESLVSTIVFRRHKYYFLFNHLFLVLLCFVNSFINQETEEIRRIFRTLNSSRDLNWIHEPLFKESNLTCGLFSFDWNFFKSVNYMN